MQLSLHERDEVSEESDAPVSHKGARLEEVYGTDQSRLCHLLLPFARGQGLLQGAHKGPLGAMGGATLVNTLSDVFEGVLEGGEGGGSTFR